MPTYRLQPSAITPVAPPIGAITNCPNCNPSVIWYRTSGYQFQNSPCSQVTNLGLKLYTLNSVIGQGTIFYTDPALTTPFQGGSLYYGVESAANATVTTTRQISNTGSIITQSACVGPGPNPQAYTFNFCTPAYPGEPGGILDGLTGCNGSATVALPSWAQNLQVGDVVWATLNCGGTSARRCVQITGIQQVGTITHQIDISCCTTQPLVSCIGCFEP